jgi:hypothetical protein
MIVYRYPFDSAIGKYIILCKYPDKTLIYSLKSKNILSFYFIYNYVINDRYIVNDESNNIYENDMKIAYATFRILMTKPMDNLDPKSDKYINMVAYRKHFGHKLLFKACTNYFYENFENIKCKEKEIDEIITKLKASAI